MWTQISAAPLPPLSLPDRREILRSGFKVSPTVLHMTSHINFNWPLHTSVGGTVCWQQNCPNKRQMHQIICVHHLPTNCKHGRTPGRPSCCRLRWCCYRLLVRGWNTNQEVQFEGLSNIMAQWEQFILFVQLWREVTTATFSLWLVR